MPDDLTPNDEIRQLQTDLMRILRAAQQGASAEASRAGVMGFPENALRGVVVPEGEVLRIRRRIRQLNPDAALYEHWGGAMPDVE